MGEQETNKITSAVMKAIEAEGEPHNWKSYLEGNSVLSDEDIVKLAKAFWKVGRENMVDAAGHGILRLVTNLLLYGVVALAAYGAGHGWFKLF